MSENSSAFERLHPKIRRWIWDQGWTALREVQELSIPPILSQDTDVIIAAATATGKTEAAFLPICTKLLEGDPEDHAVIYLSPLKALINDQFSRIEQLCEHLHIDVHPWHGDISVSKKRRFLRKPAGILLITPESLEAIFVNNGHLVPLVFANLRFIVVDELHSFIGSERGRQVQSLLSRIDFVLRRKAPRIGLSATIGDMWLAADFLRPGFADEVKMIVSHSSGQELKLLLRAYVRKAPSLAPDNDDQDKSPENVKDTDGSDIAVADALYRTLRGNNNLVFANSRNRVEFFSDLLRRMSEEAHVPNEFLPHHGSLSKELREDAESAIKDKSRPLTIVCTSTLELGIDIGAVSSIAQVSVPPSVASMRQRLGRSGRRGEPAVLRIYVQEDELSDSSSPSDVLRASLVQTVAMVRLLLAKWYEPPPASGLHLSTLIQQVMSLIAQYGGVTAEQAWNVLCNNGAFSLVTQQMFAHLLRSMGSHKLITQASDGLLLHGQIGERIVNHYAFYTAFVTPEEYRLVSGERTLGTLPIDRPLSKDSLLIFGGKRWLVLEVDSQKKVIVLKPAKGGKPPVFDGQGGWVHDRVRQEMFEVYTGRDVPIFLDAQGQELLNEARENFDRYGLARRQLLAQGSTTYVFTWMGDRVGDTLAAMLRSKGMKAANEGIVVAIFNASMEEIEGCVNSMVSEGPPVAYELAKSIINKASEKYDLFLAEELLSADYAASKLDTEGAFAVASRILESAT